MRGRQGWMAFLVVLCPVTTLVLPAAADQVAQSCLTQDWSDTTLIEVSHDWSGVPGIIGRRGSTLTVVTGQDPQLLVAPDNTVHVFANTENVSPATPPGVIEYEADDPSIVLYAGGGGGIAPHLVLTLNTIGATAVTVSYDLRDVDALNRNSIQSFALQYRVGTTGNYTNIPAGYVADATTGPDLATLVTPVTASLPVLALHYAIIYQEVIEVRIITVDATGPDEWVAVDNITVEYSHDPSAVVGPNGQVIGAGFDVLLHADVSPALCPPSTGITVLADLSAIGGGAAVPLLDDGTNGDDVPGDWNYQRLVTVGIGTPPGPVTIPITVADAEGRVEVEELDLTILVATSLGQSVEEQFWITDGTVESILPVGNSVHLGGSFSVVGPHTGGGGLLHPVSGTPLPCTRPFLRAITGDFAVGSVSAVVSDGSGGWFVGGSFSIVGDSARANLAHILADGSVGPWNPGANDQVYALARSDSTLYVGGTFTQLGGIGRTCIGAVSVVSGGVTPWAPVRDNEVNCIAVHDTLVYVGGRFSDTGIPPTFTPSLVAVSAVTGAVVFQPAGILDGEVYDVVTDGRMVYVAGRLTPTDMGSSQYVTAFDAHTGVSTGFAAVTWQDAGNGSVRSLELSDGTLYIAGLFEIIRGQPRRGVAALDATTGALTPWAPDTGGASISVRSVALSGGTLYLGGSFRDFAGQERVNLAAVDAVTGSLLAWAPPASGSGSVFAIAATPTGVFVGGNFNTVGGVRRQNLCAIDVTTGMATSWNPGADGPVRALAASGPSVYVGGAFSNVAGQSRNLLAAVDAATGSATAWNPQAGGNSVGALLVANSTVYVSGDFYSMGGQGRAFLAALDATTGAATAWNPNPNNAIDALASHGGTLYVGGDFIEMDGVLRPFAAAFDLATGDLASWAPELTGGVQEIAVDGSRVFLAGSFYLLECDAASGAQTSWSAGIVDPVTALAQRGDRLYVGGDFLGVGDVDRVGLAELDIATGDATSWSADLRSYEIVNVIAADDERIYIGGTFDKVGASRHPRFAVFSFPDQSGVADAPPVPRLRLASTPNPTRGATALHFTLPAAGPVTIDLFDVAGRRVTRVLENRRFEAGPQVVPLETGAYAPGIYFVRLESGGRKVSQKVVVVR